ncbi:MAG TPA: AAA family ATPase [Caldisericia bacterium]|nr:AAA family ATPase [Caldisericia bacterium]HPF48900.1 AAA family ATPase [Caldisericia bacterium]HPI83236.1 AAA family ATPase [Caldisericia bacterium]HPQ92463.1 AAA family ATPase [Caldisericia bacterium]HRV74439.1 AAA family ATPase [Caldisericia bacterium]
MAQIVDLKIKNFRGIKNLEVKFNPDQQIICFIGRGDSGKSTILEAINYVLYPYWYINFSDTDFFNCNTDEKITIEATLVNLPKGFTSEDNFGLNLRKYILENGNIEDDILDFDKEKELEALTIQLTVDETLEPEWNVINGKDNKCRISHKDRAKLNCFKVSDLIDSHFSFSKGRPLYTLMGSKEKDEAKKSQLGLIYEKIKSNLAELELKEFEDLIKTISDQAAIFGLNTGILKPLIELQRLSMGDEKLSLHDNNIPLRLKGKGSKRLASIAIQTVTKESNITLIDEIEQGLEPDRICQLIRALKNDVEGQVFVTTHSGNVIQELSVSDLLLISKNNNNFETFSRRLGHLNDYKLQGAIRACPEAFFCKKIIVCEGATEVGICRALDKYKQSKGKNSFSYNDCTYMNGGGGTYFIEKAKKISEIGLFDVSILCDCDDDATNHLKDGLPPEIQVFDCEDDYCIEKQVLWDFTDKGVIKLSELISKLKFRDKPDELDHALTSIPDFEISNNWREDVNDDVRNGLLKLLCPKNKKTKEEKKPGGEKGVFKNITNGEILGDFIFHNISLLKPKCHLFQILNDLSEWVDGNGLL